MLFPVKCKGNRGILLIENKPIWIVYQPILIYLSVLLQLLKVSIMKDIFIMIKRTFILLSIYFVIYQLVCRFFPTLECKGRFEQQTGLSDM